MERCQCAESHKPLPGSIHKSGYCQADAVRKVTVPCAVVSADTGQTLSTHLHRVPMCEACASAHESK